MKRLFLLGLTLTFLNAFAQHEGGGVIGGGGDGIVCREGEEIISVELLDIYEGRILHNRHYDSMESMTVAGALNRAAAKLYSYSDQSSEANATLFRSMLSKFHFLPSGTRLEPINDSGHIFIPPNCKIEQVANFYNPEKIFVVSDFYNKMDVLNKAALVVHETLYWFERLNKVENSRYARRVVGAVFDRDFIFEKPTSDNRKKLICSTPVGKTPGLFNYEFNPGLKKITSFEMVKVGKHYQMQFILLNGHMVHSRISFEVDKSMSQNWFEKGNSEDTEWSTASSLMSSGLNEGEFLNLSYTQKDAKEIFPDLPLEGYRINQIKVSWEGSDPGDSFEKLEFLCADVEFYQ